jgi:SAM-dependent methyltransferase
MDQEKEVEAKGGATGQLSGSAADVYEAFFVPALFRSWAPRVAAAANVSPGQRVLDVACGTGVLAREVAGRVAPSGSVVGLDLNPAMLEVAREKRPDIAWRRGAAEALPFEDATFDAAVSQFGLMFFQDRERALREMLRVLRPGGRLAVAVWDGLDHSAGYAAAVALLEELFGPRAADALRVPFSLGDPDGLAALFARAGGAGVEIATHPGTARFPSIEAWMFTEIRGWTLAEAVGEAALARLVRAAERTLQPFVVDGGAVAFPMPAHIVTASSLSP